jgi:hypothetical protein
LLVTCQQEFQLAAYQGDAGGQLAALHKCAALSGVAADTFLELCELSRGEQQVPLLKTQLSKPTTAAAVHMLMTKHLRLHHQCSNAKQCVWRFQSRGLWCTLKSGVTMMWFVTKAQCPC